MELTKAQVSALQVAAQDALDAVAAKFGMTVGKSRGTFGGTSAKLSFEFSIDNKDENGVNLGGPYADAFKNYHGVYGLPPTALGKMFKSGGKDYRFAGLDLRRKKCIVAVAGDKTYLFPDAPAILTQLQ